jgi:hypothetical protein
MATLKSNQIHKHLRNRGPEVGDNKTVTGEIKVADGTSIATTDLIQMLEMGENTRPVKIVLQSVPLSGTPVLTNATFNVGVQQTSANAFVDAYGKSYAAVTTDADQLSAALAIDSDNMASDVEVPRPVADSVANYAPYFITLTPAGAGAFSVAGGDIKLRLTVTLVGRGTDEDAVYTEYVNQKVDN